MLELMIVLCLSAVSTGIFLRVRANCILPAVGIGLIVGIAAFLLGQGNLWFSFVLGNCCAAFIMAAKEKRSFLDGFFAVCIGVSQLGLWITFFSGLKAVAEGSVVLFLYTVFFMLHIPAVLLTFDRIRLPNNWKDKGKKVQNGCICGICVGMPVLIFAVCLLPNAVVLDAVVKILVSTAVFWLCLFVMLLLVVSGQQQDQSAAEGVYHNDMNTFMNVVRSQRHDYNLHVQTVASLIAQQKWEECRSYVNALVQDTNEMNAVLPVKDPAIASLIHNYRILMAQSGHTLLLNIRNDMSDVVTGPYETNKIIGNLLQNALDEVSGHDRQETIELDIFKRGEYCIVSVSNRVPDPAAFCACKEKIFSQGYTTKPGHDGVGLSSIHSLAGKYGGDVSVWIDEDIVHFVASIPIRLNMTNR